MAMDAAAAAAAAAPQPSPLPLPEAGTGTYVMGGVYVSGSSTSFFSGAAAAALALVCTVVAVVLSVWHIWKHLQNYTEPTFQRYIVRIIFMVPVYSCMSFGALVLSQYAMYFNTIRDVYEAWVIYNFLSLCLAWVGGPGAVVTSLTGRLLKPSYILMTCCLPPIPLDGRFIRRCKQGCLQFVYLKPILATLCLVLYSYGLYTDGNFSLQDGYLYITGVYMLSYTGAIYSLILFYVACKDLLRSFNPVPKFLMIKAVVFLTYWQGVVVFTVAQIGLVNGVSEAADLQNVLICIEMALGAVGFLYAFPYTPFMQANVGGVGGGVGGVGAEHLLLSSSIKHAMNLNDVVSDTVHQFAPTYHDYVLYSDGSQDVPHHFRTRTFVPVGAEMEAVRKAGRSGGSRGGSLLSSPSGAPSSTTAPVFGSPTSPTGAAVSSSHGVGSGPAPTHAAAAAAATAAAAIDLEAAFQQQAREQELGGSASGGSLATQGDLSQGSTPRLPPPPQDLARSSGGGNGGGTSWGGSSGGDGGSLTGAGGGSRRGTNESTGSAGTGGHRTSSEMGSESTSLRRPARKQDSGGTGGLTGVDHHFDGLLVDEDDLVGDMDSSRDLEGFVSR